MKQPSFLRHLSTWATLLLLIISSLSGCAQTPSNKQLEQLFADATRVYNVDNAKEAIKAKNPLELQHARAN